MLLYFSLVFLTFTSKVLSFNSYKSLPEDAKLFFTELSFKYGHPAKEYRVVTEDGYILQLFRWPGKSKIPVLLMHGLFSTADSWILRGNTSLPVALVNAGYDVWIGNIRGNKYSRRHSNLNPNKRKFWNFSFHELAVYDLSAIIDTVLDKTGAKKINAMGHSQGNSIFYVLSSTRPEYNEKVNLLIALSPVCYFNNAQPPVNNVLEFIPIFGRITKGFVAEIFGPGLIRVLLENICPIPDLGYFICAENILFPLAGFNKAELGPDFVPVLTTHFPSSSSLKNLLHLAQVYDRKIFAAYDYGPRNVLVYNSTEPPEYDLNKVTMPVVLIAAKNDRLSTLKDVELLRRKLPNVVGELVMEPDKFNHIDYLWGEHTNVYLHPFILSVLEKYS
ncbi:lipase 1-like [Bicyclus anynana]|uniref:Lipase n=1 Tax=Bicyclus anynana TaxID=110368 RepID=A0A6J1NTH7_BICAN|nr:lipase 1-like [Bicyclus anynana]